MLHWRIEVAALKAILLTFDHLLKDDPNRFTRADALAPVRKFVRGVVESDADEPNLDQLADFSLGLQYELRYIALYEELRKVTGVQKSMFDHTLIVSADPPHHTVDAVFWAFETDPHAFRLTQCWQGGPFTYVMTNGILLNEHASAALKLSQSQLLGRPNIRRNQMRRAQPLSQHERDETAVSVPRTAS